MAAVEGTLYKWTVYPRSTAAQYAWHTFVDAVRDIEQWMLISLDGQRLFMPWCSSKAHAIATSGQGDVVVDCPMHPDYALQCALAEPNTEIVYVT